MATASPIPRYLRAANVLTRTLLRAGLPIYGPDHSPMYLLTVRGRKSGEPRTTPIATIEQDGNRYLMTPYGVVDWVRNLRCAGEATLIRGRRSEKFRAIELPTTEATVVLKKFIETGNPIGRFFDITTNASHEEFEHKTKSHPVFLVETLLPANPDAAR